MRTERDDVIIVGASFAGLALALAVARSLGPELRIAILERGPGGGHGGTTTMPDSRASALSAGSRRVLDALGIWSGVAAVAAPVSRIEITDSSLDAGFRPVQLTYDNVLDDGSPASWIVPNGPLLQALTAAVAAEPSIRIVHGAEVARQSIDPYGLTLKLADGTERAASLAVAADGRRSALREAAGIGTVGWRYGQTGIVTTVAHDEPHRGTAVQHFLPAGPFAMLPLQGRRSCITWSEEAAEAERIMALDDAAFLNELERRLGGRLGILRLDGPRQSWPLDMHLARAYVAPRIALIGDAAHGVHPIAGQGLNLALRDVAALAEVMADAARLGLDLGSADALARYERWRRFDSFASAASFDALNRLFSNDWLLVRAARDAGLGAVDRMPMLKRLLVEEAAGLTGELPRLMRGEPP